MEAETNGASTPQTLEASVSAAMHRAQSSLKDQYSACEESVRKSPGRSLLVAGLAGYLFRNLPIGALLGGILRLLAALLRPAVLFYLAAKGYEMIKRETAGGTEKSLVRETGTSRRPQRSRG